eukprot:TRINITY_DN25067_c0_g1_i1.p1 TRINITY_DN25067_c0_g1~~TRINITY_DN25067_c0_g1_i1.p1  ORF type:complete len:542 (+),score=49.71 TRINITY_DN25067_c0_g1_i1:57-1628(+)
MARAVGGKCGAAAAALTAALLLLAEADSDFGRRRGAAHGAGGPTSDGRSGDSFAADRRRWAEVRPAAGVRDPRDGAVSTAPHEVSASRTPAAHPRRDGWGPAAAAPPDAAAPPGAAAPRDAAGRSNAAPLPPDTQRGPAPAAETTLRTDAGATAGAAPAPAEAAHSAQHAALPPAVGGGGRGGGGGEADVALTTFGRRVDPGMPPAAVASFLKTVVPPAGVPLISSAQTLDTVNSTLLATLWRPSRHGKPGAMFTNMLWHLRQYWPGAPKLTLFTVDCPVDLDHLNQSLREMVVCVPLRRPCGVWSSKHEPANLHSRCKFSLLYGLLRSGTSVLWTDDDTAVRANPMPNAAVADVQGCWERKRGLNLGFARFSSTSAAVDGVGLVLVLLHGTLDSGDWSAEQRLAALHWKMPFAVGSGHSQKPSRVVGTRAAAWDSAVHACRSSNKDLLRVWRKRKRELVSIHASGGCSRHLWGKKGFLIEMGAWYNRSEVEEHQSLSADYYAKASKTPAPKERVRFKKRSKR